ncbi:MAG: hypothetical protein JSW69_07510 [Deltaproteobacteria bacterium]|nr:MAG: hypothetical protein JSW69_07510 [Deltaproteobacteria bacterium]
MNPNFFNLSKRKKRDVLTDLLLGKSSEGIISKKELNALNKLIEGQPAKKAPAKNKTKPVKTRKIAVSKRPQKVKKKTTHYLSQEISENLDKVQMDIRSRLPENLQSGISKSHIVNQALAIILQEFEAKGKNSRLMQTIVQKT